MTTLSVVIPIKDEVDNLRPLHERLHAALDPLCDGEAWSGDHQPDAAARLRNPHHRRRQH